MLVRLELRQSCLLEWKVGMKVGLRGLDRFMTEPQRDHRAIDARLQELHCSAVPQDMWRHPLGRQRWAARAGDTHMLGHERLDAVGAQPTPCRLRNRAQAQRRTGSLSQVWRAIRGYLVSGVHRSFQPLLTHRTCEPAPRWMASLCKPISSERRKPAWAASNSKEWSRRPSHDVRSGATGTTSISARVRKCTWRLSCRLLGIASTRRIRALCAGSSTDTNRKKERMAVRRRLRVVTPTPRFISRSVKNVPMKGASSSSSVSADGALKPRLRKHDQQPECIPVESDRVGADVALAHEPFGKVALDQRTEIAPSLHGLSWVNPTISGYPKYNGTGDINAPSSHACTTAVAAAR